MIENNKPATYFFKSEEDKIKLAFITNAFIK